jgi:hypothetical protein
MGLRLKIVPGFDLPSFLAGLAAVAVRNLMSAYLRPTSARADDRAEHALIARGMAIKAPIAGMFDCPLAFANAHLRRDLPEYSRVAYHLCKPLNGHVSQCLLYDGTEPDARLIGVEYLVSDEVYRQMPAEEKLYWHDHKCEVDARLLTSKTQSGTEAKATLANAHTLWGKVYYTWASGSDYPRGPSRLLGMDTGELPLVLAPGAEAQLLSVRRVG